MDFCVMATNSVSGLSAHTKVATEKCSFSWVMEKFSQLEVSTLTRTSFFANSEKCLLEMRLYPCRKSKGEIFVSLAFGIFALKEIPEGQKLPSIKFSCRLMNSGLNPIAPVESWNENDFNYDDFKIGNLMRREELLKKLSDDVLKINVEVTISMTVTMTASLQRPSVEISNTIAILFETRKFSDFVIRVQETDLPVHKSILAAKSPVFEAMLSNDTNEAQTCLLELQDMELTTARAMVEFLYVGGVSDLDVTLALGLLSAADKYNIVDLFRFCSRYLQGHLCYSNVIDILVVASEFNASELKKTCFKYINMNRYCKLLKEQMEKLEQQKDLVLEYFYDYVKL